jgi:Nucleotidyltransferase of unknown function (DUF6036)
VTGEHLAPDIKAFVQLLARHRVRYLLVGGEAVIHHGYPRLTGDVDFFFERTPANVRRLYRALREFWGGDVPAVASADELSEPDLVVQFGRPPNRIDLLNTLGSVSFSRAWRRRVREKLRLRSGAIPLPIIALPDLLQSKRDAGRHKDRDDIEHLSRGRRRARR